MDKQDSSSQRVPPQLLSVVIPALPPSMRPEKKGAGDRLVKDGPIALVLLTIAFLLVAEPQKMPILALLVFGLIVCLSLAIALVQKKKGDEQVSYEKQLYDMTKTLSEKNVTLKEQVQVDPLTQLLNRRGLEKALTVEGSRRDRNGIKVFAALIDADDFKQINENYGHAVGDLVLQNFANGMTCCLRPTDYASRVGGDEFLALLVDIDCDNAMQVSDRIRRAINDAPVKFQNSLVRCTASIGVAELSPEVSSIEDILFLCRNSLKASKNLGKNKISLASMQVLQVGKDGLR